MQCETCQGTGRADRYGYLMPWLSCLDCSGSGIAHCCDGLQAQPSGEYPSERRECGQQEGNMPTDGKQET